MHRLTRRPRFCPAQYCHSCANGPRRPESRLLGGLNNKWDTVSSRHLQTVARFSPKPAPKKRDLDTSTVHICDQTPLRPCRPSSQKNVANAELSAYDLQSMETLTAFVDSKPPRRLFLSQILSSHHPKNINLPWVCSPIRRAGRTNSTKSKTAHCSFQRTMTVPQSHDPKVAALLLAILANRNSIGACNRVI